MAQDTNDFLRMAIGGEENEETRRHALELIKVHQRSIAHLRRYINNNSIAVRLPPEILSTIFMIYHNLPVWGSYGNYQPINTQILCHVCSRWREVALNTPLLWNHISTHAPAESFIERLKRSQQVPIEVNIPENGAISATLLVLDQLYRIRNLTLTVRHPNVISQLAKLLSQPAPVLQSIQLTVEEDEPMIDDNPVPRPLNLSFHADTPQLRSVFLELPLAITSLSTNLFPRSTVTSLYLINRLPTAILPILRQMPQLETLGLRTSNTSQGGGRGLYPDTEPADQTPVGLPRLRHLALDGTGLEIAWYMDHIEFPPWGVHVSTTCFPDFVNPEPIAVLASNVLSRLQNLTPSTHNADGGIEPITEIPISLFFPFDMIELLDTLHFTISHPETDCSYGIALRGFGARDIIPFFLGSPSLKVEHLRLRAFNYELHTWALKWAINQEGQLKELEFRQTECVDMNEFLIPLEENTEEISKAVPSPGLRFSALTRLRFFEIQLDPPPERGYMWNAPEGAEALSVASLLCTLYYLLTECKVPLRVVSFVECYAVTTAIIDEFRGQVVDFGVRVEWDGFERDPPKNGLVPAYWD